MTSPPNPTQTELDQFSLGSQLGAITARLDSLFILIASEQEALKDLRQRVEGLEQYRARLAGMAGLAGGLSALAFELVRSFFVGSVG